MLDKEKGKGIKPALALVKRRIYEGNLEPASTHNNRSRTCAWRQSFGTRRFKAG